MRRLTNGGLLVESAQDLPVLSGQTLYLDCETDGLDPYKGRSICGVAVAVDEGPAYYVPVNHNSGPKVERDSFDRWLRDTLKIGDRWVNHNIKFDAHFCAEAGAPFEHDELVCTLALARLIDSDRWQYGLKPLCRDWLNMPMDEEDRLKPYVAGWRKEYGHYFVPSDIEAPYACMDVIGNRALWKWMQANLDEDVRGVWDTEIKLTPVLWDMERRGMRVDIMKTKVEKLKALRRMVELGDSISQTIGYEFVNSSKVLRDILVVQHALPILGWNRQEDGSLTPSFDKEALALYSIHPTVTSDTELTQLIADITEYRTVSQFHDLYLEPYLNLADEDGVLHPSYRQTIRTGRMAGSHPNPMQLNKPAKSLIIPRDGNGFLSMDASQVEFRWIGHYTEDQKIIAAFAEDARADYHQLIADLIHSTRKQGKTMNFALGFGAQEKKVVSMLKKDPDIMAEIAAMTDDPEEFEVLCEKRAREIYKTYHKMFPGVQRESRAARNSARIRGQVSNAFGRPRHLPRKAVYKAFNAVIQSTAMDYIKTRMVALSSRYNPKMRDWDLHLLMNVHDENVFEGPDVESPEIWSYLEEVSNICPVECSIPMRWDIGSSRQSWLQASLNSDLGTTDDGAPALGSS